MNVNRVSATVQLKGTEKAAFLTAIKNDFNGASDFFRRCILEKCDVQEIKETPPEARSGFVSLNVSITPEQRAALLTQCEKEGVTMGTWMRNQIKEYLSRKEENK